MEGWINEWGMMNGWMDGVYLYLLDGVDDESVLQVFHCSLHPVVKGRSPFGKLQVQLINCLQQLLRSL